MRRSLRLDGSSLAPWSKIERGEESWAVSGARRRSTTPTIASAKQLQVGCSSFIDIQCVSTTSARSARSRRVNGRALGMVSGLDQFNSRKSSSGESKPWGQHTTLAYAGEVGVNSNGGRRLPAEVEWVWLGGTGTGSVEEALKSDPSKGNNSDRLVIEFDTAVFGGTVCSISD